MLSSVLRTHCVRSALSSAAFRNASPTVFSLVVSRSFLTTAQVLKDKAEKSAKATKATAVAREEVKVKATTTKDTPKKTDTKALANKTTKEHRAKEKEKAKAKAIKEKQNRLILRKREQGKRAAEKLKAKEKKEQDKVALKNSRPPFKKPLGGFIKFTTERLSKIEGPEPLDVKQVARDSAQIWNAMSEAEKQAYTIDRKAKEEYDAKYKEWKAGLTRKERQLRKHNRICYTPYNVFIKENFPKTLEGQTFTEAALKVKEQYKALSPEEHEEYVKRAAVITAAKREAAEKAAAAVAAEKAAKKAAKEAAAALARNIET